MADPPKKPDNVFDENWWEKEKEKFIGKKKTLARRPLQSSNYDPYRMISSEYERFTEEPVNKEPLYLKLLRIFARFDVDPDPDTREKMGNALRLLQWDTTP